MAKSSKKKVSGIFFIILACFIIYLAVVTFIIMAHYKRPANSGAAPKIHVQAS